MSEPTVEVTYDDLIARRARVLLGGETMLRMLGLPEEYRLLSVLASQDPTGLALVVVAPSLPPVPMDAEAPPLGSGFAVETVVVDGKVYGRIELPPPAVQE